MEQEQNIIKDSNAPTLTKKPRKRNLLLKVLGGAVLAIFLYLILIFWLNGCPWGTYSIMHGYLFYLLLFFLLVQIAITIIRRKAINKLDKIFLLVNIILIVFLYFSSYKYCIWD
ncbi:hypothetical protein KKD19_02600 [Patescibacteria group bacterium]|nr:hypothetical protein [Patescibacteria group bacterium]MCG2693124.1 hypothetical protein [Candidatus Parcubacteria bacterium]